MVLPAAYREHTQSAEQSIASNAATALVSALQSTPILDGELIEDVVLSTTGVNVSHGLGRPWRGWVVVDIDTTATVYRASSDDESVFLRLRASAGTPIIKVWVF